MTDAQIGSLNLTQIYEQLKSSPAGLNNNEANIRLQSSGPNQLDSTTHSSWKVLKRQFTSPFIWLLLATSFIALVLGEKFDSIMILVFVSINTALGFFQENRSEKTILILKNYVTSKITTLRNNTQSQIAIHDLVPGDIISLSAGNLIPADIRFISTESCLVDESILTGESIQINKDTNPGHNIGYSGTSLVQGKATGIIYATGQNTQFGSISKLAIATKRVSSFEIDIGNYSKFIIRLVVATLVVIFIANIAIKGRSANKLELLLFSLTLAVSVIPEALPVVTTFSLSSGARRLAKSKVIVKRLSAIEDLGSIDVLCTDKTGTLTENKLAVSEVYGDSQQNTILLSSVAGLSGSDPFDESLKNYLSKQPNSQLNTFKIIRELPFDPTRRRNTVLASQKNSNIIICRGAPEAVLPLCKLTPKELSDITIWMQTQGHLGHRLLVVASKIAKAPLSKDLVSSEKDLQLVGAVSFIDPLKTSTIEAISTAKRLGIAIKIATGDSIEVAHAVAVSTGLIKQTDTVTTGEEFLSFSIEKQLLVAQNQSVFARMTPTAKYHLIQLLSTKHRVGFLGEGINDAPALKISHVGLVVQSASDISRESADIILLQKSLHVIISGIKEGREVAINTSKYLTATLASNFGNFYAVAIASLLIPFLPMLPLQILLVNLLSDFPMISIATDNVDPRDILRPHRHDIKNTIILASILGGVSTIFDFITFGIFMRLGPPTLQTAWFMVSVLTELLFIFVIRSRRPILKSSKPSIYILALTGIAISATIILPYLKISQDFFSFIPLPLPLLVLALSIVFCNTLFTEIAKISYFKHFKNV